MSLEIQSATSIEPGQATPDTSAPFYRRWLHRPQNTFLRKAVFQLHLWSGMLLGLYIVVVCVSGSIVVFRIDLYDLMDPYRDQPGIAPR